ncbi:MAG: RNA pseudouridine synthase [Alphaproteobacteria bacterium]|nr:MAG: RNA pseudouridine synthase [Alphaproteobacteria bacterium]
MREPVPDFRYEPPEAPLEILHHDAQLLVVNKPAGLLTVPGRRPGLTDCLLARVQAVFPDALLVHRLDMATSGVIVFALTRHAQRHLGLQFERRHARKSYIARVWGAVEPEAGEIDLPLAPDPENRPRHKVDPEHGRAALTRWKVIRREDGGRITRLRLFPETGRSHQLRVHLKAIGHPILGDALYAEGPALAAADRLQLHAESLRLRHPDGGRGVTFRAPCPF